MDIFEKLTSKLSKDITHVSLPNECNLYYYYSNYYLEGFDFKNDILNKVISILKEDYNYYQINKHKNDFKTEVKKTSYDTFVKDFMDKRKNDDCAKAYAFLLMFRIITYYRYYAHGNAFEVFKRYVIQEIKKIDRKTIPESFFYHFGAEEYLQEEREKQEDLTKKYLNLYDAYTKVRLQLSKYEDEEC